MLYKLISNQDYLHLHKILGFGCLINYFIKFYWKFNNNNAYLDNYSPLFHLGLSLSSFIC